MTVWDMTYHAIAIVGLLSLLIAIVIISDIAKIRITAPDSFLAGLLVLYILASIVAFFGLSVSLTISVISLMIV